MEFLEGIDVDVEEDFADIGDIQLPFAPGVHHSSTFCTCV